MRSGLPGLPVYLCAVALYCLFAIEKAPAQDYFTNWFDRVSATQAEQPHWITPLVTVTPRLEEEFRYDFTWQRSANGTLSENYGGGKGLELIPERHVEIILGIPSYIQHNSATVKDGAGDTPFLLKYRLFSGNEEHGNYIVTVFVGGSLPSGSYKNGATDPSITPTVAFGKGWGHLDFQSTLGKSFPTCNTRVIARPVALNNAFQYRILKRLWPEVEINSTFFPDGANAGKKQTFITPGLVVGRIPLYDRLGLTLGTGVQIAATQFHTTNHNWIFTMRLPF
ncbi:MAG TPA: hypothetical protein VKY85_16610 [Candidatus Angelobacter sp.]|nr:hypothetical protein [Candidatus Angelobacter sp.]